MIGCSCSSCFKNALSRVQTILACRCYCHTTDEPCSHDSLCCECPGYTHKQAEEYKVAIVARRKARNKSKILGGEKK